MADGLTLMDEAARAIQDGRPLSPDVADWLEGGFRAFMRGESLADALRLSSADMVRARNSALIEAAAHLGGDVTAWEAAGLLEVAVRRFESRVWSRVRDQLSPTLPPIDAALYRAFASGARPLRSQRRLYELLR